MVERSQVKVVIVYIQRTEAALVIGIDWDRPDTTFPVQMVLDKLLRQRLTDNLVLGLGFPVPMAVENLYCGIDRAWAETRVDLDLSALRRGNGVSHDVACRADGELVCTAEIDG